MFPALHLAVAGAMGIAIFSALFGAAVARWVWAEDLSRAISLDDARSGLTTALRGQIGGLERQIAALESIRQSQREIIEAKDRTITYKDETIATLLSGTKLMDAPSP